MSKTVTANVPQRKVTYAGKPHIYQAYSRTFVQDDAGRWSSDGIGAMTEAEVIDACRKASNWTEIKAAHFPMHGFHA